MKDNDTQRVITYPARKRGKRAEPRKNYVLAKELVIPAGTPVDIDPPGVNVTYRMPRVTMVSDIGADKDSSWEFSMDFDEAVRVGLIKEVE